MRKELSLDKSTGPGWHEDEVSFRASIRVDGQPAWRSAITPRKGTSLSWAVKLAERT